MSVEHRFDGKFVVVTGAAAGIGRAIAQAFGAAGASVVLIDRDRAGGKAALESVPGGRFVPCDLTSEDEVRSAVAAIGSGTDRVDVLVNNAGGFGTPRAIEDTPLDEWRQLLDVNLTSAFLITRELLPLLRRSGSARIVNLGSLAGQTSGWRTSPAYSAAKAGLHGLTRVLAWELASDGITVNTLSPTAVLTERIERLRTEEEHAAVADSIPLGRYQSPEELAQWALFLASPEAGFMTGQVVSVNGGRFMA